MFEIDIDVSEYDKIRHKGRCPITNSLAIAGYLAPRTEDTWTAFSDRKTDTRYKFRLSNKAQKFIKAWDTGKKPKGFTLILTQADLISAKPRGRVDATARRRAKNPNPVKRVSNMQRPVKSAA